MNYPITVLQRDIASIQKKLQKNSTCINNPEQFRIEIKRIKELKIAIELCQEK